MHPACEPRLYETPQPQLQPAPVAASASSQNANAPTLAGRGAVSLVQQGLPSPCRSGNLARGQVGLTHDSFGLFYRSDIDQTTLVDSSTFAPRLGRLHRGEDFARFGHGGG